VMFTRWKSPAKVRIPSILSLLSSHDSPFFGTLTHPCHTFIAEAVVSLTTPRSSNGLMILFNNALVAFSSLVIYCCENGSFVRVGLCEFGGFRVDGCGGVGMGSRARFVEDEEFDGLRDARRASPAVQLETLVLGTVGCRR
jgi:hypothetical protein